MVDAAPGQGGDAAEEHQPVIFDGTLPAATGNVAQKISATNIATQRQQADAFYNYLALQTSDHLLQLNEGNSPLIALINVPTSKEVKLLYCAGIGASPIGDTSPLDGKFLFLHGEGGNDLGNPDTLVLPGSIRTKVDVLTMSAMQFSTALTEKGANYSHPLLARARVADTSSLMQISPIPPFLVYDGFETNLDAAEVLERVLAADTEGSNMYTHLMAFLRACLSSHNINDNKPYVEHTILVAPSADARRWGNAKFKKCFPALVPQQQPGANAPPDYAAILAQLLPAHTRILQQQQAPAVAEEKQGDSLHGFSNKELEQTLIMCGKDRTGAFEVLPGWFRECAEKGCSEKFKLTIIRTWIMTNYRYDDAEVPLSAPLLKSINLRNWLGKDGNIRRPSLINAVDGLSPFLLTDLHEDEVAQINDEEDTFDKATFISVDAVLKHKKKLKPKVPETAEGFLLLLKRYANLLYAIFSEDCPYYKCIVTIIDAFKEFSRAARASFTFHAKAAILWIILLQGRRFALGEMDILAEFSQMQAKLAGKDNKITHAELPAGMLEEEKQEKHNDLDDKMQASKKLRGNSNCWHPTLKEKLARPLEIAGYPSFTQIMKFCNADASDILSRSDRRCTPNIFFGRCFHKEKCTKTHSLPSEEDVTKILRKVDKFIRNPEGFKKG